MFGSKEYIGLAFQDDVISMARLRKEGSTLKLIKLDRISLIEEITIGGPPEGEGGGSQEAIDEEAESVFGLEEEQEEPEEEDDLGLDELEEADDIGLDMVEEADQEDTNEMVLYNLLTDLDEGQITVGLNIPCGSTMFQINRDTDFSDVKKKDLIEDIEDKLLSIYGEPKSSDNYSYEVRDDGSLLLASTENEPISLKLLNNARELYSGKLQIQDITPDEMLLVGLARANYEFGADEITGIIQFGKEHCRVVFMKGKEVWHVSPIINEGTSSKSFLNTIFSKVLFQLDTGEVPNLDRILLANNTIGEEAINFFEDNFPDVSVDNLKPAEELIDTENVDADSIPSFTTAIGTALAAEGELDAYLPELTFLPKYVVDRQKIFQLEWHGMLILFLIFLTPLTFNYFYLQNSDKITSLNNELNQVQAQLENIQPVVQKSQELQSNLSTLRQKLVMLDTLAQNSKEWSTKMDILNEGMRDIGSTWITSMSEQSSGSIFIQGYSLYKNRIPRVVNIFDQATLMNVNFEDMREQEVFSFAISVSSFSKADSMYSPSTPPEVQKLIQSNSQ